ncbi:MAG: hypothetical protein KGZ51_08395 [Erysipelothrix sp.]|jgi:hypothetical protein|nr:hypothetical protein [Erysipelothrix sp.]
MNKLQKTIDTHALNDQKVLKSVMKQPLGFGFKLAGALALTFLLMFALLPTLRTTPTLAYQATVRVEINPAFDITVDQDDLVVDIVPLNDDALGFDKGPYLDGPVDVAITAIIAYALENGFITEDALESDVVAITVVGDEDEEDEEVKEAVDNLGARIKARLESLEEGLEVDVVFIKATLRELFEARGKEIPLGLYVIGGAVLQEDGTYMPMKEFMATKRAEKLDKLTRDEKFALKAIRKQLKELREEGEDTDELEDELEELESEKPLKERLEAIKERIKERKNNRPQRP